MPAVSKKQQKFMGMVHAYQQGKLKGASPEIKKAASSMSMKSAKDFASTKRTGLPTKKGKMTRTQMRKKMQSKGFMKALKG